MTDAMKGALLLAALVVGLLGSVFVANHYARKSEAAEHESQVWRGRAESSEDRARSAEQDAQVAGQKVAEAEAKLADLKGRLARVRQAPAPQPVTPGPVLEPAGSAGGQGLDRDWPGIVAAQDAVIAQQDQVIASLKVERDALKTEALEWKNAAGAREREAAGLQVALKAQKHLNASSAWRFRAEGLAIGIGLGFLGGRSSK